MKVKVLNGPNLNMLGKRDNALYGGKTLEEVCAELRAEFPSVEFTFFQSNIEGELVTAVQDSSAFDGLIINAGAYSHYSIALRDALETLEIPKFEVHITNIYAREEFRRVSVLSAVCDGVVAGCGTGGYGLAVTALKGIYSDGQQ